jgi:hypothetical protein
MPTVPKKFTEMHQSVPKNGRPGFLPPKANELCSDTLQGKV